MLNSDVTGVGKRSDSDVDGDTGDGSAESLSFSASICMTNEEFSMTEKSLRESTLGRSGERCEENGLTMVARWREKTVLKREAGVAKDTGMLQFCLSRKGVQRLWLARKNVQERDLLLRGLRGYVGPVLIVLHPQRVCTKTR